MEVGAVRWHGPRAVRLRTRLSYLQVICAFYQPSLVLLVEPPMIAQGDITLARGSWNVLPTRSRRFYQVCGLLEGQAKDHSQTCSDLDLEFEERYLKRSCLLMVQQKLRQCSCSVQPYVWLQSTMDAQVWYPANTSERAIEHGKMNPMLRPDLPVSRLL